MTRAEDPLRRRKLAVGLLEKRFCRGDFTKQAPTLGDFFPPIILPADVEIGLGQFPCLVCTTQAEQQIREANSAAPEQSVDVGINASLKICGQRESLQRSSDVAPLSKHSPKVRK